MKIKNVSENGSDLELKADSEYYIIDALYLDQVRTNLDNVDIQNIENDIREKALSGLDIAFAKIKGMQRLKISDIVKATPEDLASGKQNCFASDTGLLVVASRDSFLELIHEFSYDDLTDSLVETINPDYWRSLTAKYGETNISLILSPGYGSGFDFDGGGRYVVKMTT